MFNVGKKKEIIKPHIGIKQYYDRLRLKTERSTVQGLKRLHKLFQN